MKYLLATDGSQNATACVQHLCACSLADDDLIRVIAVWEPRHSVIPARLEQDQAASLVRKTVETLKSHFDSRVSGESIYGEVAATIVRVGNAWQADRILLGAHALKDLPDALVGDIAKQVVEKSKRSIMIYRQNSQERLVDYPRVLWCVDTEPLAENVLAVLPNFIDLPRDADLRLIHILKPASGSGDAAKHEAMMARAQSILDQKSEQIRQLRPDVKSNKLIVEGSHPVAGILTHAQEWQSDLIIMGAHSYDIGQRILLGSASAEVAHRAKCSVAIIR